MKHTSVVDLSLTKMKETATRYTRKAQEAIAKDHWVDALVYLQIAQKYVVRWKENDQNE